jgi:hypothetical protein
LHLVLCILYFATCSFHLVHGIMYYVHDIFYFVNCTFHLVLCILYFASCTLHCVTGMYNSDAHYSVPLCPKTTLEHLLTSKLFFQLHENLLVERRMIQFLRSPRKMPFYLQNFLKVKIWAQWRGLFLASNMAAWKFPCKCKKNISHTPFPSLLTSPAQYAVIINMCIDLYVHVKLYTCSCMYSIGVFSLINDIYIYKFIDLFVRLYTR